MTKSAYCPACTHCSSASPATTAAPRAGPGLCHRRLPAAPSPLPWPQTYFCTVRASKRHAERELKLGTAGHGEWRGIEYKAGEGDSEGAGFPHSFYGEGSAVQRKQGKISAPIEFIEGYKFANSCVIWHMQ